MDILIKGMEMPQQMESPITITIFKNGSVWMNDVTFGKGKLPNAKAVALPEHGKVADVSPVIKWLYHNANHKNELSLKEIIIALEMLPTIVEASNGYNN